MSNHSLKIRLRFETRVDSPCEAFKPAEAVQFSHTFGEPWRNTAPMKWKVCHSGTLHAVIVTYSSAEWPFAPREHVM